MFIDVEKERIIAKVEKDKLLDDLFNPNATMAAPLQLAGKTATHVWMDDPWDI